MKRFTLAERVQIQSLLETLHSRAAIAKITHRNISSINYEVSRGSVNDKYDAEYSDRLCTQNKRNHGFKIIHRFSKEELDYASKKYHQGISILQIAKALNCSPLAINRFLKNPCHESVDMPVLNFMERLNALEEQVKILTEILKEIKQHD